MTRSTVLAGVLGISLFGVALGGSSCGGSDAPTAVAPPEPAPAPVEKAAPTGPLPALILTQARFEKIAGKIVPRPAALWLFRKDGETWHQEIVEDGTSNVFHKGMWWNDGILTIGAMRARLVHWTRSDGKWTSEALWEQSWGGKFDRLRDLEIGDLNGDGVDELVLATHDKGVVAVGQKQGEKWMFTESPKKNDTFVHEIEIGDVDGDGVVEFYATPSDRNRSSGASQQGGVSKWVYTDGTLTEEVVVHWEESHAKEILVADTDADGKPELYAVREAHVKVDKVDGKTVKTQLEPVKIVRLDPSPDGWKEVVVATLDDDQCRFLTADDIDHDGSVELLAAGHKSGLWRLERQPDGTFAKEVIATDSAGFEHAVHTADLDGDGKVEIYVAADDNSELRVHTWNGSGFDRKVIAPIPARAITWNIQDGRF